MGRYLTTGMNILPQETPERFCQSLAILTLFIITLIYLFTSKHAYQFHSSLWLLSGLSNVSRCHGWRTLSQFVASCEFSSTVVCWCAVSCNCHFPISHLKCSLQKLAVNWLLVLQQFCTIRNPNLMLLFLQGGKNIFSSWFIMLMMNSYILLYLLTHSSTST